ncbi:LysR substrate-binding domain-containing protein [Reyranella sp.]|uniref:LysR substrate-binding domain-containing protein n=1 Tax=Reyranella sp. TaxID=1929291 RepID=UPI003BA84ABF
MTPTQLRAFHLVAESGSFSAAARASGLSQPNLSSQVTALEQRYGVRLFDRRGRTVVPTETGRQLHGITTRLFAVQDEARALLAGEQALTRGHLRIAADSAHHVVPIMAALRTRAEGLTFALAIDNSAVVLERVLRHEADVAVMAKSVSDPRLHAVRLRTDRVVLFVPAGHPLARRRSAPLRALAGQSLVLRERGSITREVLEQAMAAAEVRPDAIVEVQTREGVREAVAAGFGIGAVFAAELGEDRRFRPVAVADANLDVAEYAVCLQERRRVALVRAFMDEAVRLAAG